jgi:5-formyltetrahydrofolate cyclo-ligase
MQVLPVGWNCKKLGWYFEPTKGFDDDLNGIDLIIVPAMAVSILGQRVGYGGGFYDGCLKIFVR